MGRPRLEINWALVQMCAAFQRTQEEAAALNFCTVDTLENACLKEHGITFSEFWETKRIAKIVQLAKTQWDLAIEDKNPTMCVWLGKNYLGQTDRQEIEHTLPKPVVIERLNGSEIVLGTSRRIEEAKEIE